MTAPYVFHLCSEPQYLEISLFELHSLKIVDKLSDFSLVKDKRVLLDGYGDTQTFIRAYRARHGHLPNIDNCKCKTSRVIGFLPLYPHSLDRRMGIV